MSADIDQGWDSAAVSMMLASFLLGCALAFTDQAAFGGMGLAAFVLSAVFYGIHCVDTDPMGSASEDLRRPSRDVREAV